MKNKKKSGAAPEIPRRSRWWPMAVLLTAAGLGAGYLWGAQAGATQTLAAEAAPAEKAEVEQFVATYFSSWSDQNLAAYGACFHPSARIWFVPPDGNTDSLALQPFLRTQEQAHARSPVRMKERALETKIEIRNGLANVWVHWELVAGAEVSRGYDFYTLVKADGRWRILSLIFNSEPTK